MNHSIKNICFVSLIAFGISACETTGGGTMNEASFFKITELLAFEGGVVGKTLGHGSNHLVIESDGTWGGNWNGNDIGGEWVWEDGAFCRTINTGPRDCQIIEMSDKYDEIRVTRNRGTGKSFKYRFTGS